jgi:hypothetical protein
MPGKDDIRRQASLHRAIGEFMAHCCEPYSNALLTSPCASFDSRLKPMPFSVATVSIRPFNCAFSDRPATGAAGPVPRQR